MGKLIVILFFTIGLVGCKPKDYELVYRRLCNEAATVPFSQVNSASTCGGIPIVLAIAQTKDPLFLTILRRDKFEAEEVLRNHREVLDASEPITLRTPLMVAFVHYNYQAAEILISAEYALDRTDVSGGDLLYYMMLAPPSVVKKLNAAPATIRRLLNNEQKLRSSNAIQLAVQSQNYAFAWRLITLLNGQVDFLELGISDFPDSFFYDVELEKNPNLFEGFAPRLLRNFSGEISKNSGKRAVKDYSLLHFAAAHNMSKLVDFLLDHGAIVDGISSDGSPLALALSAKWSSQSEYNSRIQIVEALLKRPRAIRVPDALAAALKTEIPTWVKRIVSAGGTLSTYEDILFVNQSVPPLWRFDDKRTDDDSGNTPAMQAAADFGRDSVFNTAGTVSHSIELYPTFDDHPNGIGQTLSGFLFFNVPPKQLDELTHGLKPFLKAANENSSEMDHVDDLGMLPLHYWLASPLRAKNSDDPREPARLRQIMSATKGWSALTINRDSILSLAVMTGNLELVKEVLRTAPTMQRSIRFPNAKGKSPLDIAEERHFARIYAYLKKL